MKVLVTGATGFLGRKLAERLHRAGHEVTALGRNAKIGKSLESAGMRFFEADLADEEAVEAACLSQNMVFHSGALSSPWGPYKDFFNANVLGTRHVAQGCLKHGVGRLVHVSTPSLYFDFSDRLNIRESDPLAVEPANFYVATKLLAEREVEKAAKAGLETIVIRPRGIFGPGDTSLLPRLIRANEAGKLPLFSQEGPLVDVTYVENVVDALLNAMEAPREALGRIYNVTNGEPVRLAALLKRVFESLDLPFRPRPAPYWAAYGLACSLEWAAHAVAGGQEPVLTRYTVGVLAKSQTLDITQARRYLGYAPRVSLDEGIQAFAAWWKAGGA